MADVRSVPAAPEWLWSTPGRKSAHLPHQARLGRLQSRIRKEMVQEYDYIVMLSPSDGLDPIQRAIMRYLANRTGAVHCNKVIRALMQAKNCPVSVTPNLVDGAILCMAHPSLNLCPALDYWGRYQSANGWFPGPAYRMVAMGITGKGLITELSAADDLWNPAPLCVHVPVALFCGYASWRIQVDDTFSDSELNQAPRRLTATTLHILACSLHNIYRIRDDYQSGHDLHLAWESLIQCGASPHGRVVEKEVQKLPSTQKGMICTSPMVLATGQHESEGVTEYELRQPSCGSHIGDDLQRMSPLAIFGETDNETGIRFKTGSGTWRLPVRQLAVHYVGDSLALGLLNSLEPAT